MLGQATVEARQLGIHQPLDGLAIEPVEDRDRVDPVDEFGRKPSQQLPLGELVLVLPRRRQEPFPPGTLAALGRALQTPCAEVAGHEDQGVAKAVGTPARGDGEQPVIEHVEQRLGHLVGGLLQFVEQHDARLSQRPLDQRLVEYRGSLLAPHVTGRRAGDRGGVMLLRQRVHVDTAEGLGTAVQGPGQGSHQLRLAHPGRAEKQGRMQGAAGVGDIGPHDTQHALEGRDRLVLAEDLPAHAGDDGIDVEVISTVDADRFHLGRRKARCRGALVFIGQPRGLDPLALHLLELVVDERHQSPRRETSGWARLTRRPRVRCCRTADPSPVHWRHPPSCG